MIAFDYMVALAVIRGAVIPLPLHILGTSPSPQMAGLYAGLYLGSWYCVIRKHIISSDCLWSSRTGHTDGGVTILVLRNGIWPRKL